LQMQRAKRSRKRFSAQAWTCLHCPGGLENHPRLSRLQLRQRDKVERLPDRRGIPLKAHACADGQRPACSRHRQRYVRRASQRDVRSEAASTVDLVGANCHYDLLVNGNRERVPPPANRGGLPAQPSGGELVIASHQLWKVLAASHGRLKGDRRRHLAVDVILHPHAVNK
jgi:hypothetical protein